MLSPDVLGVLRRVNPQNIGQVDLRVTGRRLKPGG